MALVIGCSARDPEYVDALLGERIVIIKIDDYVKVVPRCAALHLSTVIFFYRWEILSRP